MTSQCDIRLTLRFGKKKTAMHDIAIKRLKCLPSIFSCLNREAMYSNTFLTRSETSIVYVDGIVANQSSKMVATNFV